MCTRKSTLISVVIAVMGFSASAHAGILKFELDNFAGTDRHYSLDPNYGGFTRGDNLWGSSDADYDSKYARSLPDQDDEFARRARGGITARVVGRPINLFNADLRTWTTHDGFENFSATMTMIDGYRNSVHAGSFTTTRDAAFANFDTSLNTIDSFEILNDDSEGREWLMEDMEYDEYDEVVSVSEPSILLLLGLGIALIGLSRKLTH